MANAAYAKRLTDRDVQPSQEERSETRMLIPALVSSGDLATAVVDLPSGNAVFGASKIGRYSWLPPAIARFRDLMSRPVGWDSYKGQPLRADTATFAFQILSHAMRMQDSMPDIVPSSDGGVQLEWHTKGVDLEVYIAEPYVTELWFHDRRGQVPDMEIELADDFGPLMVPLRVLAAR